MTTTVQYLDHCIEIPDVLQKPFALLSCMLTNLDFKHPFELLDNDVTAEMVDACILTVAASIGVQFGNTENLKSEVQLWLALSTFEKLISVLETANQTEPYNHANAVFRKFDEDLPE